MNNKFKALSAAVLFFVVLPSECLAGKQFNQSPFLPAREQAMVNRVQASITAKARDTGEYGVFDRNCGQADIAAAPTEVDMFGPPKNAISTENGGLNVGRLDGFNRPKEQIIVADAIINVGGHCRVRR